MHRIAVGCVVASACLTVLPAQAADIPISRAAAAAPVMVVAHNWTGWYVGGHLGAIRGQTSVGDYSGLLFPPFLADGVPLVLVLGTNGTLTGATSSQTAFLGGGQLGYNWQINQFVLGFEGDISATGLKSSATASATRFPGTTAAQTVTVDMSSKADWMASLRARLGFAADRVLVYFTGGAAWAHVKLDGTTTVTNGPVIIIPAGSSSMTGSDTFTRLGWTVGFGFEWAVNSAWSVAGEYRHSDFGSRTVAMPIPDGLGGVFATAATNVRLTTDQATLRVNYRFAGR